MTRLEILAAELSAELALAHLELELAQALVLRLEQDALEEAWFASGEAG